MNISDRFSQEKSTKSDINEHLQTLFEYGSKCNHITEMGVRTGRSTLSWLMASPSTLVCYDLKKNKNFDLDQYSKWASDQGTIFLFIEGDTRYVTIEDTDLLFIDTLHTYDQLKIELSLHSGKVNKYIILHDTETFGFSGEIKGSRGLQLAVDEFLSDNADWRLKEKYNNNNGLTILEKI